MVSKHIEVRFAFQSWRKRSAQTLCPITCFIRHNRSSLMRNVCMYKCPHYNVLVAYCVNILLFVRSMLLRSELLILIFEMYFCNGKLQFVINVVHVVVDVMYSYIRILYIVCNYNITY